MAAKSNAFEIDVLEHFLNNVAIANIGDATGLPGSATNGSLYASLHTADPGEGGNQSTSECAYTGYARVAIARNPSSKKWTVASDGTGTATNVDAIVFGQKTAGTDETALWIGIGASSSGAGKLMYKGLLNNGGLLISNNVVPTINAGAATISEA